MASIVRVAAIQPRTYRRDQEGKNVKAALDYVDEAARNGANIICFPEGFPGPYSGTTDYSCTEELCAKAKQRKVYVIAGMVQEAYGGAHYITEQLIAPNGEVTGTYRRVQIPPKHVNEVLTGKSCVSGSEEDLRVFETDHANIGILVCSEVYCPELARILALKGADIIFYPSGGMFYELCDTWKNVIWTRSLENLVYVVMCHNIFGMEDGMSTIVGPEQRLGELKEEGMLVRDLDLNRLRWLRENEERLDLPKPYRTIPGVIKWRRPELYGFLSRVGE